MAKQKTALELYQDALADIRQKQQLLEKYRKDIETALVGNTKATKVFNYYADAQLLIIDMLSEFSLNVVTSTSKLK
jgi:hypothetical protein